MPTRLFDYGLAAASGVLLALSFPRFGHPALGWIALAPLLVALSRSRPQATGVLRTPFALGLLTGVIYFSGTLYWITRVMAVYGGLQSWVAVLVNALLIAYLSLFPALFAVIVRRLVIAHGTTALMAAPLVWVTTELGRTYLLTGFPWVLVGYSQAPVLPIAQLASVFGVYGLSLLVAASSAALAQFAVDGIVVARAFSASAKATAEPPKPWRRRAARVGGPERAALRKRRARAAYPLAIVLAMILAVAVWGSRRVARSEWTRTGDPIRVGLVQGNVDQGEKWDPARASAIFQEYLRMTREAIAQGAQFVLWPESSTPFFFEEDRPGAEMVRATARNARVTILLGSDQVDWRAEGSKRIPDKYYNSAFVVRPDGTTAGAYRKMHLVPFGEYVPLKELLFFAGPLVEAVGPFSAGIDPTLLPVNGHPTSVAICYEVVYPNLIRQFVVRGSELLTTITNDAWFGQTSAPYQHFAQASMRAIEEGRYLVRSANTGISGIVDPYGRVVAQTPIFEPAVLVGEARFLREWTFYTRHGDIVGYASAIMTAVALVLSRRSRRM